MNLLDRARAALRSSAAGDSGALLAGSVVNGIAAYAFIAVGTRHLGADGFAPVAILWVFWALSAAVLTFPVQHWVIRQMAVDGHAGGVRASASHIAGWIAGVAAVEAVVALALGDRVFGEGSSAVWALLVAGVAVGSGLLGVARGTLAGSGRYRAAATVIGGENVMRLAAAGVVAVAGWGSVALGLALLTGPLVIWLFPRSLALSGPSPDEAPQVALLGSAGVSLLLAQIVLNGGPPVLAALGAEEAAVTALFASLAVFRAPYLLALGVTVRAMAPLTERSVERDTRAIGRVGMWLMAGSVAAAFAAAAFGAWAGPPLIRFLFGEGSEPSALVAALAAAGCTLALGSLGLTVALISRAGATALIWSWALALAVAGVVLAVGGSMQAPERVVLAFVVAEGVAVGAMGMSTLRWAGRTP